MSDETLGPDATDPHEPAGGAESGAVRVAAEPGVAQTVRGLLGTVHGHNATAAIRGPDEWGGFPAVARLGGGPLDDGVPPVVVDANLLRNDVRYSCRTGRRTVLITAANAGAVRLFAASHVIEEVAEHGRRWARETAGVSYADFETRWRSEYLALIREVADDDLSWELLDPAERRRLAELEAVDPDDIPSVILCLVLGAFFLSRDEPALLAVYGADIDIGAHRDWVATLKAGGEAGALGELIFAAGAIPGAAGAGLLALGKWIATKIPPSSLLPIGLAGAGLLAMRMPQARTLRRVRDGLTKFAVGVTYAYGLYQDAYVRFRKAAASGPAWSELAQTNEPRMVLTRACLHTLARSPQSQMSARSLAAALPDLGVGQGEALVRETLRSGGCFAEPYAGHWQLGHAVAAGEVRQAEQRQ